MLLKCSDREVAVAVAGDALQHLGEATLATNSETTLAVNNGYLTGRVPLSQAPTHLDDIVELVRHHCKVCLLGACLLSKATVCGSVQSANHLHPSSRPGWMYATGWMENIYGDLDDVFGRDVCSFLDSYFEGYERLAPGVPVKVVQNATKVLHGVKISSQQRARVILQHIIDNAGCIDTIQLREDVLEAGLANS